MDRFFLLNLGCAKNLVEGEHIAGMLISSGFEASAHPQDAELLLVNTCGFIRPAVEESLDEILNLTNLREPGQRVVVIGCLVGRYGKKLMRSLPEVDLFVSPGEVSRLPQLLMEAGGERLAMSQPREIFTSRDTRAVTTGPGWTYLRVSDGCVHRCAFCTIPAIRGSLRSRDPHDILAEARALGASGIKELILVAQDLTAYGHDLGGEASLGFLIQEIDKIREIKWLRLLYLHPDTLGLDVLKAMAQSRSCLPYLDIPLQHIADPVLTAMGRRKTGAELKELLALVREMLPEAVLRTTLMVGHPGEGQDEFEQLKELVSELRFDHLGCFVFEPEPGTRSARWEAPPREEALARHEEIMEFQSRISAEKLAGLKGKEEEIMVLGPHPETDLLWHGRLWRQAPEVDGETIITSGRALPGEIVNCRITKSHEFDLEAELLA